MLMMSLDPVGGETKVHPETPGILETQEMTGVAMVTAVEEGTETVIEVAMVIVEGMEIGVAGMIVVVEAMVIVMVDDMVIAVEKGVAMVIEAEGADRKKTDTPVPTQTPSS